MRRSHATMLYSQRLLHKNTRSVYVSRHDIWGRSAMLEERRKGPTRPRVTISTLQKMKREREPIAALSIYDTPLATAFEQAGGDLIIVGDSAEMTVHGRANTLSMTMEKMIV